MTRLRILLSLLICFWLAAPSAAGDAAPPLELTVAKAGFAARYHAASAGSGRRAAVLLLGGSDGGYPSRRVATDLAATGHPVLALAYAGGFSSKIDGLPDRLARIPLEYVFGAIDWLRAQAGSQRPIAIMGESRGAELALLVASRRPDVAGVVAFSPSSLAWPAVGDMTAAIPAWTEGGRPVPYVALPTKDPASQFSTGLTDREWADRAAIPIERAAAAIMLVSSRSDAIWPASRMADQLEARLRAAHYRHPVVNHQFDDASHLLMGPGQGMVKFTHGAFTVNFGGSEEGTLRAREAAWRAAKQFLADLTPAR